MKKTFLAIIILFSALYGRAQSIEAYDVNKLLQRVSNTDTIYVVNFFATWCGPCIKELPEFAKLQDNYNGKPVKILLVSLDFKDAYPGKVQSFIKKKKLGHEVVWFSETDANEFIPKIDNRWQGSIPATMVVSARNEYKGFWEGMIKATQIQPLIDKQLALQ